MSETSNIGTLSAPSEQKRTTQVTINVVSNGYIIGGYCVNQKIANTLDEALVLARKELE